MSSYYRQFAKRKDFLNILKELQRRLAKQEQVTNPLETIEFKQHLRANHDRILFFSKFKNEINAVVQNPNLKYFQGPFEPDGDKLRLWYRFNDYSAEGVKDWSGFRNHGIVVGSPFKQTGHTDYMDALAFDGISEWYVKGPHKDPDLSMENLLIGFGVSVWVKPLLIDLHGGKPRVIACKVNDDIAKKDKTWSLWVEPDGTLFFAVRYDGVIYVRRATQALATMDKWYHITAFFGLNPTGVVMGVPGGYIAPGGFTQEGFTSSGFATTVPYTSLRRMIIPLHIDGVEYAQDVQTINDRVPYVSNLAATDTSLVIGGTDEEGRSKWAGAIGDFRYFYEKMYNHLEALTQFTNKYTISDIDHIALAGIATTAYEKIGVQVPPAVGEIPPDPPVATTPSSASAKSASPKSTNVDETGTSTGGGGGGASATIPDQFFDAFSYNPTYSLDNAGQISPDSNWKLTVAVGAGGFVKTADYKIPRSSKTQRVMRMRTSDAGVHPIITANTARFHDVYARCRLRTVGQVTPGDYNHAFFCFKYVGINDFYFVVVKTTGAELWKRIGGVDTQLGFQSNPTARVMYPIGSEQQVVVFTKADGTTIDVAVNGNLVIHYEPADYNPPDSVITSLSTVGVRATSSNITVDNFLARPVVGDSFQVDDPYTLTTVNEKSPNQKWQLIAVPDGTGGAIVRTYDHSLYANGGRVLNLNSGTGATIDPCILSTTKWKGIDFYTRMATLTQHDATDEENRAQLIFKYKDANNYYWLVLTPTGWKINRIIDGETENPLEGITPTFADNPAYPFHEARVRVWNAGRDFAVLLGTPQAVVYEEHSQTDGLYVTDGGILSGFGQIGFRAQKSDAVFDNCWCRML